MAFRFPWTNFHELNLDWILEVTKQFADLVPRMESVDSDVQTALDDSSQALETATTANETANAANATAEEAKDIATQAAAGVIGDGSVTTPKIANGAVTLAKLGSDVNLPNLGGNLDASLRIIDGTVVTDTLADSAVTTAKIANEAVTRAKLSSDIEALFTPVSSTFAENTGALNSASNVEIAKMFGIVMLTGYIRGLGSSVSGGTVLLNGVDLATYVPLTSNTIYFTVFNASGNALLLKIPGGTCNIVLQNTTTISGDYYMNFSYIARNL